MAGSQFRDVSDVCTAMKQYSTQTSQSSAKGSFATHDMLTTFSEAITRLCEEVVAVRAELDELKSQSNASAKASVRAGGMRKKASPKKAAAPARRAR